MQQENLNMLDQQFSVENFRKIYDYENRKGINLIKKFGIPDIDRISNELKLIRLDLRKAKEKKEWSKVDELKLKRKELLKEKDTAIDKYLEQRSKIVNEPGFQIRLHRVMGPKGKFIYTIKNDPNYFFAIKQVQRNLSELYKLQPANRNLIISQLKSMLSNGFKKCIVRTDISSFYESIDQVNLKRSINGNRTSPLTKKILFNSLREFNKLASTSIGIPRGLGISAYLSELSMRRVDEYFRSLDEVAYYARYVDDIIIIFIPNPEDDSRNFEDETVDILENEFKLKCNRAKTYQIDMRTSNSRQIEFLGYKIGVGDNAKTSFSKRKIDKIKLKISTAFDHYESHKKVDIKSAKKMLVYRIRFLTSNTRLFNNKRKILIGIYYSNKHADDISILKGIDKFLESKLKAHKIEGKLLDKLQKMSFYDGFVTKKYSPFNVSQFQEITSIWKSI